MTDVARAAAPAEGRGPGRSDTGDPPADSSTDGQDLADHDLADRGVADQGAGDGDDAVGGGGRRRERTVLGGVVVLAAVSALVGLGRRPFWLDESLSAGATSQLVDTWRGTGGTMAGYYALLTPWSWLSLDREWLRLPSVALALLVLPLVHHVAKRVVDERFALLSTAIVGGSWAFARYAQEARAYTLALLVTTVGWTAMLRWVAAPPGSPAAARWRLVFVAAAPIGLLAHGLTGLQVLAQLAALALRPDRRARLRAAAPAVAGALGVLLVLSWLGAGDVGSWVPPLSLDQLHDLLTTFTGPPPVAQLVVGGALAAGTVVAVRGSRRAAATEVGWLHAAVVVWALVPAALLVALSVVRPYLVPRYVLGSLPAVAMLVAMAVPRAASKRGLAAALLVALAAASVAARVDLHREPGDDWAGAAHLVSTRAEAGDLVAFSTQTVRPAFDYAWQELPAPEAVPEVVSPIGPLGEVRRLYLVHDDAAVADRIARSSAERVWVVGARLEGAGDELTPFLHDPALEGFDVAGRHRFSGGIDVVLLERR